MTKLDDTKRLMGALVRMKPKPHEEMKIGKKNATGRAGKPPKSRRRKAVKAD
jgi:hypothetical protein